MKKEKNIVDVTDIHVRLKPVHGISPGVYLTVLYGFILLVLLFFLLVFPGIRKNGTQYAITTTPEAAVVFVDNQYRGTTPCSIFIEKGQHTITVKKDFFKPAVFKKEVKGRLFFSLLFPRRISIHHHIDLLYPEKFLKKRYAEISGYALMNDFYKGYQYPPLITRTVKEFKEGSPSEKLPLLYGFLYSMRYNFGNKEILRDYSRAINYLQPKKNSAVSDFANIQLFYKSHGFSDSGLLTSWIASLPEKERPSWIKSAGVSNQLKKTVSAIDNLLKKEPLLLPEKKNIPSLFIVKGFHFRYIPGGQYTAGDLQGDKNSFLTGAVSRNFPHRETVKGFYMLESEVTAKQYALFLKDTPQWRKSALDSLVKENLVTKDYLKDYTDISGDKPISEISWYAASAFASWLTTQLPPSLKRDEVRLPTEAEWEWAARQNNKSHPLSVFFRVGIDGPRETNFQRQGSLGLTDMLGNVWEWCNNYYFPSDTYFGRFGIKNTVYSGAEKAVRGGSWANQPQTISVATRGSQTPSWCTPFLGFRVVLARKGL